ncbi:MAG: hypothetical protein ABSD61_07005 [Terracidiphilus sp.]|jgi:hypothetical protein
MAGKEREAILLTDKDLALRLVDWIESLLFDRTALEAMLESKGFADWESTLGQLKQQPKYQHYHAASLQQLRDVVLEAPDWSAAVRQLLDTLERNDTEGPSWIE